MLTDRRGNPVMAGRVVGDPTIINLSVASARVGPLPAATVFRIWSSVDCFFTWGDNTVVASTSSNPMTAKLDQICVTDVSNLYIAATVSSGNGAVFISQLAVND